MEGWRHRGGKDNRKEVAKEAGEEVQKYKGGRMEREREKGGLTGKRDKCQGEEGRSRGMKKTRAMEQKRESESNDLSLPSVSEITPALRQANRPTRDGTSGRSEGAMVKGRSPPALHPYSNTHTHNTRGKKTHAGAAVGLHTRLVSCVSIMKLCTCFSALVSSSFLATTATTRAVQPAP